MRKFALKTKHIDMKRKLLFAFAAILVSVVMFPASARKDSLKVLYWNIQNGMWDGQADNYDRFVDWVSSRNPDICVWAEAQSIYKTGTNVKCAPEDRYLVAGWKELASRYGHKHIYVGGHRDNYPQVITSKYPIRNVRRFTEETPDTVVTHGSGWARVNVKGHELNIVTLHTWPLGHAYNINRNDKEEVKKSAAVNGGDHYRAMEIEYICRHTILTDKNAASNLWLMLGDYNSISPADNDVYKLAPDYSSFLPHKYILANTPYIDSVREHNLPDMQWTIPSHWRYDYLYMSPALDSMVKRIGVIYEDFTMPVRDEKIRNFFHPSDHLPIEAVIDISRKH